nr:hypothetical protein [uncultured Desulfuromonas sp.]
MQSLTPFNSEETCLEPHINWSDYQWVLLSGKGQPACEAMLAYLTSRPADAPPPVCPEERLPPNSDWTRPPGRDLNETERQNLIDGLPPSHRQKPGGPVSVESNFRHAKLLRVLHADISRDGIPENLLAYASHDYRQECWRATHCVRAEEPYNREIAIVGGSTYNYKLLPMNDEGTQVNWQHPNASNPPMLNIGELVYYQGRPFWLSYPVWIQKASGFPRESIGSPYLAMFKLNEIFVRSREKNDFYPSFKNISGLGIEHDPLSSAVCRFGYFHREYIKRNLHSDGNKP